MNQDNTQVKLFYSTGEACILAGISAHTLRYWERRLNLKFLRSARGKRMLRNEDIDKLKRVASLLQEGYTLKSVPLRIKGNIQLELPLNQGFGGHRRILKKVRNSLEGILSSLAGETGK